MNTISEISLDIDNIRSEIVGLDKKVRLLDGSYKQYVFLDNAASTPSFKIVRDKYNEMLEWYSAIHRGQGIKSYLSSEAYDEAHRIVADFVNVNRKNNTIIFVKNTTEAINKLSYRLKLSSNDVVLSTGMEHHSNDLPWRRRGFVDYIRVDDNGYLDLEDLDNKIKHYGKKIKLIAITGASNVSGIINPYHEIARKAHEIGAKILVDAAQLSPHRKIDMKDCNDPEHIDFLVMSAHKMYAPFGIGVLICPNETCMDGDPEFVGGGMAKFVTHDETIWADLPDKEEAGTPNTIGGIAFAVALKKLESLGMDNVAEHEYELTKYLLEHLEKMEEITLLIKTDYAKLRGRLGVVAFNIKGMHYGLVSSILAYEFGIGVRSGCFCTHPYISRLLNVSEKDIEEIKEKISCNSRIDLPGAIRVSFGIYNSFEEVDYLIESLEKIIKKEYKGEYQLDEKTGEYTPKNYNFNYNEYFSFE